MSETLDGAFANLVTLGQAQDAYTTGSTNNIALLTAVNEGVALLTSQAGVNAAAVDSASFSTTTSAQAAVTAAGNLAQGIMALAYLENVQTILGRP